MSNSSIGYNGRKDFGRPRKLTEKDFNPITQDQFFDKPKIPDDIRQDTVDNIFNDLSITYLKGNKLQEALRNMEPAQFINIETNADLVSASANRFDPDQSQRGSVITYSMYTRAIDALLNKSWEVRLDYLTMRVPASIESQKRSITSQRDDSGIINLIKEFLDENGIAGTIIGMLCMSPFQSIIFQTLTVEEGAKAVQAAQIPIGIALFLELGVKAERILKILKSAKIDIPLVEQQVARLSSNPEARAEALNAVGISQEDLRKATNSSDAKILVDYVAEFYTRYGGLVSPGSHLTLDHWISYSHVARNQQTIRGALNMSDTFSPKMRQIREDYNPSIPEDDILQDSIESKKSEISIELVSVTRALRERSESLYDDIVDVFSYQLSDRDMCCLVTSFSSFNHIGWMKTVATCLRILATDLSADIVRIDNALRKMISSYFQDSLFELAGQINEYQDKLLNKLTKVFAVDLADKLEPCVGLLSVGWALTHSIRVLFSQLHALIREIAAVIGDYGQPNEGSWIIAADRRHLLGIARILEVLSFSIERASVCDKNTTPPQTNFDIKPDIADNDAILSILTTLPPTLQFTPEDEQKFFNNRNPRSSDILKFKFGIQDQQITNDTANTQLRKCSDPASEAELEKLIQELKESFRALSND